MGEIMISIIVPIYNAEKWLKRCLDSLLAQTFTDIEILMINDGSSDNSLSICENYAAQDNRFTVFTQENAGVSAARNLGLNHAARPYVQFVDSDDYLETDACQKLMDAITDCDLSLCGMRIWQNDTVLRTPHLPAGKINLRDSVDHYFNLRRINLGPCNKLYRRDLIGDLRFQRGLSIGEDTLFVLDYMQKIEHISIVEDCLYNVVLDNDNSLNKKFFENKLDLLLQQRKKEEDLLIKLYGDHCDLSKLYHSYLTTVHAFFLENPKLSPARIAPYLSDQHLKERIRLCKPSRWDYRIFRRLFLIGFAPLVFSFFASKKLVGKLLHK